MNDREDIQDVLSRYSQGCSCGDWDAVICTFASTGVWEVPAQGIRHEGHEAIRAAMSGFVASFSWYSQINSPALISLKGERATARSMIRECGRAKDRGEALEVVGFYDDELIRTPRGWKFLARRFTGIGLHGIPVTAPHLPG